MKPENGEAILICYALEMPCFYMIFYECISIEYTPEYPITAFLSDSHS